MTTLRAEALDVKLLRQVRDQRLDELIEESMQLRTQLNDMTTSLGDFAETLKIEIERLKAEQDAYDGQRRI